MVGMRRKSTEPWRESDKSETTDLWSSQFDPNVQWLEAGGSGFGWDRAFEVAANNLVKKLLPETVTTVQYIWGNPPELIRKHNGS